MHRSYFLWILGGLVLLGVVELLGIHRHGPGDTISEFYRSVMHTAWGAVASALMAWALLYHFPWGKGRPLGWLDVATLAIGVAVWYAGRRFA